MKYYYLTSNQTKIETTKEMFDSQVQYYATHEAFIELHGVLYFEKDIEPTYSDFAMKHVFEAPEDADEKVVYEDYTV